MSTLVEAMEFESLSYRHHPPESLRAVSAPSRVETSLLQRRAVPSGAQRTSAPTVPTVTAALLLLERAEELACQDPPDLRSAENILEGLHEWLSQDAGYAKRLQAFRGLGASKTTALLTSGYPGAAVRALRFATHVARKSNRPMRHSEWRHNRHKFIAGSEFLEVVTGERTLAETSAPSMDRAGSITLEVVAGLTPAIGFLVAIGEAIVGRDLSGRRLSGTERAIIGGLGLLSEIRLIVGASRAVTQAARLRILSRAPVEILKNLSRSQALKLVASARALTRSERAWLMQKARVLTRGAILSEEELMRAHRLLGKMDEAGRIAEAVAENARTSTKVGVVVDVRRTGTVTQTELDAAELLRSHLGARQALIMAESTVDGVSSADLAIGGKIFEVFAPETNNIKKLLQRIGEKHRQAGSIAVDLSDSSVSPATLGSNLHRIWAHPERIDINRILIMKDGKVVGDLARPASMRVADTLTIAGPTIRAGGQSTRGLTEPSAE